jgi:hypothetical protein
MAQLTGIFNADFTSFTKACEQGSASLKSFETDANKTAISLDKMADSISGQKIVQQALLATKAVQDVGGAAALTEKELAKMSDLAAQGAEKLRAMGQDVPAQMQKLADATGQWGSALSTATGYLSALGINATFSGLVQFTESIFSSASAIHDMGERLGISAEAVQGFKFAAEQAGSSLDAVGSAITKMNKNLAEGDKSTIDALQKAGLEFSAIRNMKPEDAFLAITDAIAKIPDPMERSDVTLKLFGKSAAELLPAITEGFRAAADGAQKMSNATVDALERAEDAWTKLRNTVVIVSGTIIAGTIDTTTHITSSWQNFWQFMKDSASMGVGMAAALATANEQIKTSVDDFVGPLDKGLHATKAETEGAEAAAKKYADAWAELSTVGTSYKDTVAQINPKIAEQAEYYLKAGASIATVAAAFPQLSAAQVKALDEMVKQYEAAYKRIQEIEGNHAKSYEANMLGLSKAENDASQKRIENEGKASDQLIAIDKRLTDEYNQQTMSRGEYASQKLWEAADAQIAAFQKTGATAEQVTQFSNKVYEETALKASQIDYTAGQTIQDITSKAVEGVKTMAAAGQAALETLQGGEKLPGSTQQQAFGQNYLISPTGARVPLGPHGEVPKNFDDLYSGRSSFPQFAGGVQNFSGGLALVGEKGPELVNLPGGSDVIPNNRMGGGGVSITIHVTQPFGTPEAIARAVADAQVSLMRGQGVRLPYGT